MKAERTEGIVQVLILITVAGMAGAASFTHVHDWTMRNVPAGTGSWLGWANAVITELVPAAAGIEIRRRKRQHRPVTYPMTILVADAAISIAVQLSDAVHTLAGGVAFALPALAFLALTKLVLSRVRTAPSQEEPECAQSVSSSDAQSQPDVQVKQVSAPATATASTTPSPAESGVVPAISAPALIVPGSGSYSRNASGDLRPVPSAQLLASARMTAFAHYQATGNPITADEIADRLGVPPALAESLLDHIDGTPPSVTEANGTVMNGSRP
jgi:hypothetical protein